MKKRILTLLLSGLLLLSLSLTVSAENDTFLIDDAELLSQAQETQLESRLEEISKAYGAQLVVVTVNTTGSQSIDSYIETLYDEGEFGYGEDRAGVMLLLSMEDREYRVLCNGFADAAIDMTDLCEDVVSYLSVFDYETAFHTFADECEYSINGYLNGYPFEFGKTLVICLIIGLVVALIVVLILRSQLKSVRSKDHAAEYVRPGSMELTQCGDFFLYRTVSRRAKPKSNSSGGSGSSRSIGGGRF